MIAPESERRRSSRHRCFIKPSEWVPLAAEAVTRQGNLGVIRLPYGRVERVQQTERMVTDFCVTIPEWALDETNPRFLRLKKFALLLEYDLLPDADDFVGLIYHGLTHSGENYPFIAAAVLEQVINKPQDLSAVFSHAEPVEANDDEVVIREVTGKETVLLNAGTLLSPERQAWLLLALIDEDLSSGPQQLLRFVHATGSRSDFLDSLILKTQQEQDFVAATATAAAETEPGVAAQTEKKMNREAVVDQLTQNVASLVHNAAQVLHHHEQKPNLQTQQQVQQADKLLFGARSIIGQKKHRAPRTKQTLPTRADIAAGKAKETPADTRRFRNEELSRALESQLRLLRKSVAQSPAVTTENYVSMLLQLQKGVFPHNQTKTFLEQLPEITSKEISQLNHAEIALLFAVAMELNTRQDGARTQLEQLVLGKVEQLHQAGLFFINAQLSNVHDPLMLHMSGGEFCFVHTPPQLQMLQGLNSSMQGLSATFAGIPAGAPATAFSAGFGDVFTAFSPVIAAMPLFAQAVAGVGGAFGGFTAESNSSKKEKKKTGGIPKPSAKPAGGQSAARPKTSTKPSGRGFGGGFGALFQVKKAAQPASRRSLPKVAGLKNSEKKPLNSEKKAPKKTTVNRENPPFKHPTKKKSFRVSRKQSVSVEVKNRPPAKPKPPKKTVLTIPLVRQMSGIRVRRQQSERLKTAVQTEKKSTTKKTETAAKQVVVKKREKNRKSRSLLSAKILVDKKSRKL